MKRLFLACIFFAVLFSLVACTKKEEDTIVIGFYPANDSGKISDTVEPLAKRLSEELDIHVEGIVMTSYNALIDAMGANEIQIGFIPAFGYVLANEEYDVEVLLKSKRKGKGSYQALYLVRTDSEIEALADLAGKVWAYPDKVSTSGYLFPAKQLIQELNLSSIMDLEESFFAQTIETGTHEAAALTVLEGDADIATTHENVLDNLMNDYPDIKEHLKIIRYTDEVPNDTISVVKQLDKQLREKVKEILLSFNEDEEMVQIMNEVYGWDGIMEANDAEYEFVKETYYEFKEIIND